MAGPISWALIHAPRSHGQRPVRCLAIVAKNASKSAASAASKPPICLPDTRARWLNHSTTVTHKKARNRVRRTYVGALCVFALAATGQARGEVPSVAPQPSIADRLPKDSAAAVARRWLEERGVTFGLVHTFDLLTNVTGGIKRGTVGGGKLEGMIGIDFEKLSGVNGLSFFANIFQLHGDSGPTRNLVGNLNTISNIEALPTTRLSEAWLEQSILGGKGSIRAGQIVVDTEFLFSQYFSFFITSDWPTNPAVNIPSGGPAYPLSTPGVRFKLEPTPQTTFLLAVFNGDPAGQCGYPDPEQCNRYGLNFRVNDPPFVISEMQYRYNQDAKATALAGGIRIGGWHHFGGFSDLRFDVNGLPLADPLSNGIARQLRGNSGIYAVHDQQLYRPAGADANSGVLWFTRVAYSPADRSLVDFYVDGGLIFSKMISSRPDDAFGVSFLYSHVSKQAREHDLDTRLFTGLPVPLRNYELSLEASYSASIMPGWTLQPNLQLIFNPGGNVPLPGSKTQAIGNAAVMGVRSTIKY